MIRSLVNFLRHFPSALPASFGVGDQSKSTTILCGNSHLTQLPAELLLVITFYLEPEHAVVLGLTNKKLYDLLFRTSLPHLQGRERRLALLHLLDTDLPDHVTCPTCTKLVKWKVRGRYRPHNCARLYVSDHSAHMSLCPKHTFVRVNTEVRDLVLRAHEKAPEYGLPLTLLDHTCSGWFWNYVTSSLSRRVESRVIDGHLIVHRSIEITAPLRTSIHFDIISVDFGLRGCDHSTSFQRALSCAVSHALDEAGLINNYTMFQDSNRGCLESLFCGFCATDIRIQCQIDEAERRVTLAVDVWQDLGNRDSPEDGAEMAHFESRRGPIINYHYKESAAPTDLESLFERGRKCEEVCCQTRSPYERQRYDIHQWHNWEVHHHHNVHQWHHHNVHQWQHY